MSKTLLTVFLFVPAVLFAQKVEFRCSGGETISFTPMGNRANVQVSGKPVISLPLAVSGSGARYSDGYTTFWNKGQEAEMVGGEVTLKGCRTGNAGKAASPSPLSGRWTLTQLNGKPATAPKMPDIEFQAEGKVAGFAGCNRFSGSFTSAGTDLKFGPAAMTRMACFGDASTVEQAFTKVLDGTASFKVNGSELTLLSKDGAPLAVFKR